MTTSVQKDAITPYGGRLIHRVANSEQIRLFQKHMKHFEALTISEQSVADLQMIAIGAYSPLKGFMNSETYHRVLEEMHLPSGLPWTLPIVLPVEESWAKKRRAGEHVLLYDKHETLLGVLEVEETFPYDAKAEAQAVYKTTDENHPGVAKLLQQARKFTWYVSGPILLLQKRKTDFPDVELEPSESRRIFRQKKWRRIVAFQTRNPIHRAHEYLQKCALEMMDGLFLQPLVGETKADDVPARIRMESYKVLLQRYYPADRVVLGVFPAAMRYAGPREAIFHAIVRRNYGCTHMIVGRDHAGVGNYYGTYEAQELFRQFDAGLLGIEPLCFEHAFYCRKCMGMVTTRTCPHDTNDHIVLSGTKVRQMLRRGELPPPEFSRPEVAQLLAQYMSLQQVSQSQAGTETLSLERK